MGANSKIEWTDFTWNPWRGCSKVSPACTYCYADSLAKRNPSTLGVWGDNGTRVVGNEDYWKQPWMWHRRAQKAGTQPRVFCASLADIFEDWQGPILDVSGRRLWVSEAEPKRWVPERDDLTDGEATNMKLGHYRPLTMDDVRRRVFEVASKCTQLTWLFLTKRPENVLDMTLRAQYGQPGGWWFKSLLSVPSNIWIGTTVENQEWADKRIPHLLKIPAVVRFLSVEPMLGAVDLRHMRIGDQFDGEGAPFYDALRGASYWPDGDFGCAGPKIDWLIVGGESGPHARPMHPDWARSLRDQCQAAGVPFFLKQWGEWSPWEDDSPPLITNAGKTNSIDRHTLPSLIDHETVSGWWWPCDPEHIDVIYHRVGKAGAGAMLDGRGWREFPEVPRA